MRHRSFLTLCIIAGSAAATVAVWAFQWPADLSTLRFGFGSYRGGFLKGAEFEPGPMTASAPGELVFECFGDNLPGGFPVPGGGMLAMAHHSDLMSVYVGLSPRVTEGLPAGHYSLEAGQFIGASAGAERGVRLYVVDTRERRLVNPVAVMDQVPDEKAPVIRSAALSREGLEVSLGMAKDLAQGAWYLLLDIADTAPSGLLWPAFSVRVLVDGEERASAQYDAAWASGGIPRLFSASGLVESDFMQADGRARYGPLDLQRGKSVISILAQDYAGNLREASWTVTVR